MACRSISKIYCENCGVCQKFANSNVKEPLIVREPASYPFEIVSSDQFQYGGSSYFVIAGNYDINYSGWLDFKKLKSKETSETIKHLKCWFSLFGIPKEFRSDNSLLMKILQKIGNLSILHQAQDSTNNGFAEKYDSSIELNFRNSPRDNKLASPDQRIMCRNTNTLLPMKDSHLSQKIVENVSKNLKVKRHKQKLYFDQHVRDRDAPTIGESVNVQDPSTKLWQSGQIVAHSDKPRSVYVKTNDG